jgi:hypothetical protein
MIKKSVFEDDLIAGMQRELRSHDQKEGFKNLDKAVDYLNSAVQILEEAGMNAKADKVLRILGKIALGAGHDTKVKEMPSMKSLMEKGVTMEDLKGVGKGDAFSKARVNTAFRRLGYTDKEIGHLIGHHNLMHEKEAADILSHDRSFGKIKEWMKDPTMAVDPLKPQPGETISFTSLPSEKKSLPPGEDLVFKSIAEVNSLGKQVHDRHTKGLTPEKMLSNLKNHGTEFNMADDGLADDLLNADIDHDPLEVSEEDLEKTFEDAD